MRRLFFLALIFTAFALEVTVLNYFKLFNVKPNIFLILLVIASLTFELREALLWGILCGILKDSFSQSALMLNSATFGFWAFLLIKLSRKAMLDSLPVKVALIFSICLLQNIIIRLVFLSLARPIPLGISLRLSSIEALYTAAVSFFLFKFLRVYGERKV